MTKEARLILSELGEERFFTAISEIESHLRRSIFPVTSETSDVLRGVAWFVGIAKSQDVVPLLVEVGMQCARKLNSGEYMSVKGFNGAVVALEFMGTFESLAALSKIKNRVKGIKTADAAKSALIRAAERQGVEMAELEELVVPTFGFELPGVLAEALGTVEARLEIVGSSEVSLRWFRGSKELKSPPADVKQDHADALKELRAIAKEVEQSLAGQKARIEGLLLTQRTLPYRLWRERYLDHPLLSHQVRRLIWSFDGRLGIVPEAGIIDCQGIPFEPDPNSPVRLWHPIESPAATVEMWRTFLIDRQITQPFKQAFREIYLLTDAERATNSYSNRSAAHILKQHQMAALMRQRGWRFSMYGWFDLSGSTPTLPLPQWGLRAEYFVDAGAISSDPEYTTESGMALYVATDQVRFVDGQGNSVELSQISPLVFTEVMRDVDLFVGVASVGNDPEWSDQGERTRGYGDYWRTYSFGDLSLTAVTRQAVLQKLLPRMKIGSVASIEDRFLVVRGSLRSYKIHLGSGNILMEPNDQYLCIVPLSTGRAQSNVYPPFEGDRKLAEILSKAVMLADDEKIKDPTIVRQIKASYD